MKGFKGGYKIVSLQLNDITSDFTLSGIYNDIKESHDKPILVSEIVVNGEKMNDAYTIVKKDDTDFIIEVYGYALTVASDDSVTVAEISQGVTSIGGVEGAITLGTGLSIDSDGELSANASGGKIYFHHISLKEKNGTMFRANLDVYISKSTAFTDVQDIIDYFLAPEAPSLVMLASGLYGATEGSKELIVGINYYTSSPTKIGVQYFTSGAQSTQQYNITDTEIQLDRITEV